MKDTPDIILPRGYWLDGECYRDASLRPIDGSDEVFLLDMREALLPVQRTTALLARCLTKLGPFNKAPLEMVRALSIGDRDALMLHLRRLTLGERLECILTCPEKDCEEKMDLNLNVGDLISPPYSQLQFWHKSKIVSDGQSYEVRFRLPNGGDQEVAALQVIRSPSPDTATDLLLSRCISRVRTDEGVILDRVPSAIYQQLSDFMAGLDPQAEIILKMVCPACNRSFSAVFDPSEYLIHELTENPIDRLYREVHLLAYYHKWSESEIMRMTPRKRRLYIELLGETLEARK
jgi:hypothetical protein